jgi:hypothetical protein
VFNIGREDYIYRTIEEEEAIKKLDDKDYKKKLEEETKINRKGLQKILKDDGQKGKKKKD